MKLTWLTVALLAFGCQSRTEVEEPILDGEVQELGAEPYEEGIEPEVVEPGIGEPGLGEPEGEQLGQQPPMGQQPMGQPPMGQQPMEQQPMGQPMGKDQLGQQRPDQQPMGAQPGQQPMGAQQQQTASGQVQQIDFAEGQLTLQTAQGETLTLHARPMDLGQVVQGDQLQVQYAKYGDQNWVMPSATAAQNMQAYGAPQTLTGTIESIDAEAGTFTVNGTEVMAHPSMLEQLRENQNVQIQHVTVEGTQWASQIMPQGAQQGT